MRPLIIERDYVVTYQLADAEPVEITGRYVGRRPMVVPGLDDGYGFDVGNKLIVLTEGAIVDVRPKRVQVVA